jgi:hypothetical protein
MLAMALSAQRLKPSMRRKSYRNHARSEGMHVLARPEQCKLGRHGVHLRTGRR